jgi:hypothetical protein
MLPSWNQIGFESLHYLAGAVAAAGAGHDPGAGTTKTLVWVVGAKLLDGRTVADPSLELRFPLVMEYDGGLLTLHNYEGFKINFVGSWEMPFGFYRLAARSDPRSGALLTSASLSAVALCDQIGFYGPFLKFMGVSEFDTGKMSVWGGLDLKLAAAAGAPLPRLKSEPVFSAGAGSASVSLKDSGLRAGEHVYSLLLTETSSGYPLALDYTKQTKLAFDPSGQLERVGIEYGKGKVKGSIRAYLMVDTYPAASARIELGERP